MLTWLLYFTSIFDLGKMPTLDIPDPGGLVQSQVVQGDAVRLILKGSQSPHTQHSQFLNAFFGSGVQHLAFRAMIFLPWFITANGTGGNSADPGKLL